MGSWVFLNVFQSVINLRDQSFELLARSHKLYLAALHDPNPRIDLINIHHIPLVVFSELECCMIRIETYENLLD
jgi:hypothetical protein